jgi:REP element-mobilizing transposase RayT
MSHSLCRSLFHIVFSTKERRNLIPAASLGTTWAYMAGIARNHEMRALAVGGIQNHAHLLLELQPDMTLSDAVRIVKCNSSRWMRESVRCSAGRKGIQRSALVHPRLEELFGILRIKRSIMRGTRSTMSFVRC